MTNDDSAAVKLFLSNQLQRENTFSSAEAENPLIVQQLTEGDQMAVLEFILMFLLQVEGIRGDFLHLYHRVGDVAVFPCFSPTSSDPCSSVNWFYYKPKSLEVQTEVHEGEVDQSSPRAARLSLNSSCSLIINNITAEDAGVYSCQLFLNNTHHSSNYVYLNILTVSPSDVGPTEDGDVTLLCSLWRYNSYCPLSWVDETGNGLMGDDDGNCSSSLTVKHQNGRSRTFSCQIVERNSLKIEASYTSVSAGLLYHRAGDDVILSCSSPSSDPCSSVNWFYNRGGNMNTQAEVLDGNVNLSSPRAARLSVNSFCSLIINNITAEDAGRYTCRLWDRDIVDSFTTLNILTNPRAQSPLKSIMWTLRLAGLILMIGVTVGLIRTRGWKNPLKESNVHHVADDDTVSYENVGERPAAPTLS